MTKTSLMTRFLSPDEGDRRKVLGTEVRILTRGEDTGGSHSVYVCTVPEAQGPPPHRHQGFDESFLVLEGELEVLVDGEWRTATVGSFVSFPRGSVHTFRNARSTPAVFLGIANPAGHEAFFDGADQLSMPPRLEDVIALCARESIELVLS